MFDDVEKGSLKIRGNYFQISAKPFLKKKCRRPMEKGRIEFFILFLEPGGNSEQNGNVKIFFYVNSNCIFAKTI